MLNRLSIYISKKYSPYRMFMLLAVTGGFFWLFNFSSLPLPISNPQLIKISGGEGLLDLKLFYTAQEAYHSMTQYGEQGRALYKRFLMADFVFACCYGLGFSMLFTRLIRVVHEAKSVWMKFNLLPLGIALADCTENIFILSMLNLYPEKFPLIGMLAGLATAGKHMLIFISLTFLFIETGRLLMLKLKPQR